MSHQLHHLLFSFRQVSLTFHPTRQALQNAARALGEFCGAAGNLRNSLPIIVDSFDILSRNRCVDADLGELVGNWLCRNCNGISLSSWIIQTVVVAYAGASLRQDAVLGWVGGCLLRPGALGELTTDAICGLAAALAKMNYLNFAVYDKILHEIGERCEELGGKQYAILLHSMASVGYRREMNALPKVGDLSSLGGREVSSIMWASGTLELKCDENIERIGMDLCRREDGEMTGIDVNNIITALAYGRGFSDRKNVFWAIRCSLGKTHRVTPANARQLSALLVEYPEVLEDFDIYELIKLNYAIEGYRRVKGEVKSSKMEMTVLESLSRIAHCEGFSIIDDNCDVGWYTVDVIVNVS